MAISASVMSTFGQGCNEYLEHQPSAACGIWGEGWNSNCLQSRARAALTKPGLYLDSLMMPLAARDTADRAPWAACRQTAQAPCLDRMMIVCHYRTGAVRKLVRLTGS
jgi:hypothetical protein